MTHDRGSCQLVPIWLMPLHLEHGHTGTVFMVAKLKKRQAKPNPNDSRSGTLSFGPNMANDYSFTAFSHWQRFYGSQIKKRQAKPNPNDSRSRTLSVGPNMANDYSFTAWSHLQRIYCSQIKKRQAKPNPNDSRTRI